MNNYCTEKEQDFGIKGRVKNYYTEKDQGFDIKGRVKTLYRKGPGLWYKGQSEDIIVKEKTRALV